MIDALLARPEIREALNILCAWCPGHGEAEQCPVERDAVQLLKVVLTALAAQPEGETLEQATTKVRRMYRADLFTNQEWEEIVRAVAVPLRVPLHARVATLEAENKKRVDALFESGNEFLARLRTVEAERDTLREALDHLVHLYRGVNKGGLSPATSDWDEAWTEADAALTGGGR